MEQRTLLTAMTDFVVEQERLFDTAKVGFKEFTNNVCNYANFLKRPLTLDMFVPCENGNVLEEPKMYYEEKYIEKLKGIEIEIALVVNKKVETYQQAKERVLFDGFEYQESNNDYPMAFVYLGEDVTIYPETFEENYKIEELTYYSEFITLSPSAIQQLKLK